MNQPEVLEYTPPVGLDDGVFHRIDLTLFYYSYK